MSNPALAEWAAETKRKIGLVSPKDEGFFGGLKKGAAKAAVNVIGGIGSTLEETGIAPETGKSISEWRDDTIRTNQQWQPGGGTAEYIGDALGSGVTQSAMSIGAGAVGTILGGPTLGAAAMGVSTFAQIHGDTVKEFRESMPHQSESTIQGLAFFSSLGQTAIETVIGPEKVLAGVSKGFLNGCLKNVTKNLVARVGVEAAKGLISEGSEEVMQLYWNEICKGMGNQQGIQLPDWKTVKDNFLGGAIPGAFLGGSSGIKNNSVQNFPSGQKFNPAPDTAPITENIANPVQTPARNINIELSKELGNKSRFMTPDEVNTENVGYVIDQNGVRHDVNGFYNSKTNEIVYNPNNEGDLFTGGHELRHWMEKNHNDIFQALNQNMIQNFNEQTNQNFDLLSDQQKDEFLSDRFGDLMRDQRTLALAAEKAEAAKAGFGQKLLQAVKDYASNVMKFLKKHPDYQGAEQYFNHYKEVRDFAASQIAEMRKRNLQSQQNVADNATVKENLKVENPQTTAPVNPVNPIRPVSQPTTMSTPNNEMKKIPFTYELVPIDQIISSDHPSFDQNLQNRNRDTKSSNEQITKIATNPNFAQLADSPVSNTGAPIIDSKNQVLSGNGRTMALRQMNHKNMKAYQQFIRRFAQEHGISIPQAQNLMLVRRINDETLGDKKQEFVRLSNQESVLRLSAAEQAENDAKIIEDQNIAETIKPNDNGDLLTKENRDFIREFINATGSNTLLTSEGQYTPELESRLQRALLGVFAMKTKDGRQLITDLIEKQSEYGIARQLKGIMQSAGNIIRTARTKPLYDIRSDIGQALSRILQMKKSGLNVETFENRGILDLGSDFAEDTESAEAKKLFQIIAPMKSAKQVTEFLNEFADLASKQELDTPDMLGGKPYTKLELIEKAEKNISDRAADEASTLFDIPKQVNNTPAQTNTEQKQEQKPDVPDTNVGKTEQKQIIEDFGEKIEGARKDLAVKTGKRNGKNTAELEGDNIPAWRKKYFAMHDKQGKWDLYVEDKLTIFGNCRQITRKQFDTEEEALKHIPEAYIADHYKFRNEDGKGWTVYRLNKNERKLTNLKDGFNSEADAMKWALENVDHLSSMRNSKGEGDILTKPDYERTGERRIHRDVTAEDYNKTFGFRGVQFGLWEKQDERQQIMNDAYEALYDLADLLNIPPSAISLNGELGLAFGARGNGGKARATYEPGEVVINLTKPKGAGTLAHEWFHALDNYFKKQSMGYDGQKGQYDYLSKDTTNTKYEQKEFKHRNGEVRKYDSPKEGPGGMRDELFKKFEELKKAIKNSERPKTADEIQNIKNVIEKKREQAKREIGWLREKLKHASEKVPSRRKIKDATEEQLKLFDKITEKIMADDAPPVTWKGVDSARSKYGVYRYTNELFEKLNDLYKSVTGYTGYDNKFSDSGDIGSIAYAMAKADDLKSTMNDIVKEGTRFYQDAKRLDNDRTGEYWSKDVEMFARAFSAFIEDKLKDQGRKSEYLSYGSNNMLYKWGVESPFPGGEERTLINKAFQNFFDEIKTETKDGKTILYSIAGESSLRNLPEEERNQRLNDLETAKKMMLSGKGVKKIKLDTGWELGHDQKWRYELPDLKLKEIVKNANVNKFITVPLKNLIDAPELFNAYPQIKNMWVNIDPKLKGKTLGSFNPDTEEISIYGFNPDKLRNILIHETQHAIQHIEGFPGGSNQRFFKNNPEFAKDRAYERRLSAIYSKMGDARRKLFEKNVLTEANDYIEAIEKNDFNMADQIQEVIDNAKAMYYVQKLIKANKEYSSLTETMGKITPYEAYRRTAGEVEARNAEERANYTEDMKRNSLLSDTEEFPADEQIVLPNFSNSEYSEDQNTDKKFSVQNVYTGSAADYDKPSLQYVGTGEGAQVYGWGLYGTDQEGIARHYADADFKRKKPSQDIFINGKKIKYDKHGRIDYSENDAIYDQIRKEDPNSEKIGKKNILWALEQIQYELDEKGKNGEEIDFYDAAKSIYIFYRNIYSEKDDLIRALNFIVELASKENSIFKAKEVSNGIKRNLYRQTFWPGKNENLISWNEPVTEEQAQKIANQALKEELPFVYTDENGKAVLNETISSGEWVYNSLCKSFNGLGSPKAVSEFLYRAGIDGVKYPAASHGKGDGSKGWNYVAFSDKDIRVDEHIKYSKQANYNQVNPITEDEAIRQEYQDLIDKKIITKDTIPEIKKKAEEWIKRHGGVLPSATMIANETEHSSRAVASIVRTTIMNSEAFSKLPYDLREKVYNAHLESGKNWSQEGNARQLRNMILKDPAALNAILNKMQEKMPDMDKVKFRNTILADTGIDIMDLPDDIVNNPNKLDAVLRSAKTQQATIGDKIYEAWINGILSAPHTHATNTIGNLANIAYETGPKRFIEAGLNLIAKRKDAATFGEFKQMWSQFDLKRAWNKASEAFNLETIDPTGKFKDSNSIAIGGKTGRAIRIPTRLLSAADVFAKEILIPMEAAARAYREAKAKGLNANETDSYIRQQISDPTSSAWKQGIQQAKEDVFQEEPGALTMKLIAMKNEPGIGGTILKYALPFIKTPSNILGQSIRKSPLGSVKLAYDTAKILAGKEKIDSQYLGHAAEQIIAWGTMLALSSAFGGDDEDDRPIITGSSAPYGSAEQKFKQNEVPPYSIRIGDTYYSYKRLEPFSFGIASIADAINGIKKVKNGKQATQVISDYLSKQGKIISEKSYLDSINQLYQFMQSPEKDVAKIVNNFAASWTPNIVRSFLGALDDNVEDTKSYERGMEFLKDQFNITTTKAGWTRRFPKVDLFGNEISKEEMEKTGSIGDVIWRMVSPVARQKINEDHPGKQLILKYNASNPDNEWWGSIPTNTFTKGKEKYYFDNETYHDYAVESGKLAEKQIQNAVKHGLLHPDNPTENDIDLMKKIFSRARKETRIKMFNRAKKMNDNE